MTLTSPDHDDVERFVRGTLGCGCPDEAFRTVSVSRLPGVPGRPAVLQLLVGSRLLVHVASVPQDAQAADWIEQLAANGRAARDRHGYNRFRLVVVGACPATRSGELEARFERAVARDERAHLHLLGTHQLPDALAPGPG
jgi:hypothetical protein